MSAVIGRIVLVLGGGAFGSELWQRRDTLLNTLQAVYFGGDWGAKDGSGMDKRLDSLAQEMRALASNSRSGTVVISNGGGGSSLTRLTLLAGSGGVVYVYARWKGYGVHDMMPVSNGAFKKAIEAVGEAQVKVEQKLHSFRQAAETAMADFRAQVEERFGAVTTQIDTRVGRVETGVSTVQVSLAEVDQRVQRMEGKIDDTQSQLSYTSQGIHLLCSVVSESVGGSSQSARQLQDFSRASPGLSRSLPNPNTTSNQLEAPPVLVEPSPLAQSLPPLPPPQGVLGSWSMAPKATLRTVESDNPPEDPAQASAINRGSKE